MNPFSSFLMRLTSYYTMVEPVPECSGRFTHHVIVFNIGKKHNIGTISRCCTAFGVDSICLVGSRAYNTFGSHGADIHCRLRHFETLTECCDHLRQVDGCEIIGIEIMDEAKPVHSQPFKGNTAFMLGNEGQGLSVAQKQVCDSFVYIAQHGVGTASLNVAVACSIVLHHFALWAQLPERTRHGEKYDVDDRPQRQGARGVVPLSEDQRAALKEHRLAGAEDGVQAEDASQQLTALFD